MNKRNPFTLLTLCILASTMWLVGCKSRQFTTTPPVSGAKTVVGRVKESQPNFKTAQANKIKATLVYNGHQTNVNGSITVITDSALVLSIQPFLGIELFRVEMDKMAIRVIDKMNRRYAELLFSEVEGLSGLPITYTEVEALLTNKLFTLGASLDPTITTTETQHLIAYAQPEVEQLFEVHKNSYLISGASILKKGTADVKASYVNHKMTNGVVFPERVELTIQFDNQMVTCLFSMPLITFNQETAIRFTNTDKYSKVDLNDLMSK